MNPKKQRLRRQLAGVKFEDIATPELKLAIEQGYGGSPATSRRYAHQAPKTQLRIVEKLWTTHPFPLLEGLNHTARHSLLDAFRNPLNHPGVDAEKAKAYPTYEDVFAMSDAELIAVVGIGPKSLQLIREAQNAE